MPKNNLNSYHKIKFISMRLKLELSRRLEEDVGQNQVDFVLKND